MLSTWVSFALPVTARSPWSWKADSRSLRMATAYDLSLSVVMRVGT
jgi:hypothetical protein